MGVVAKQSFQNTLIIFLGFAIGGINVLFLYTHFLTDDYYGLVTFLMSSANILMPLLVFGMQNTIIKYFSSYSKKEDQDSFLISALILPMVIIIPLAFFGMYFYDYIATILSQENIIIKKYTFLIFFLAIFMGYFEVFFAWSRVMMQSVFGNFIREIFARIATTFLLFMVYKQWITQEQFVYAVVAVYLVRMIIMKIYAFMLYYPKLSSFALPKNFKEIISYSLYIILAGSAGGILLEIDKFMIPQMEQIAQVAYYSVGVYIASVIGIPSRAMQQIINPITARDLNNDNMAEVESMYKKSSDILLITGGLLFLLININIVDLYQIINKAEYSIGVYIVLMVSISELYKLALGTNGAILANSSYYKMFFYFSIAMAISVIVLNKVLIDLMGIDGAALATLLVVLVFSTIKLFYINSKLKMHPFSKRTNKIMLIITILFFAFYFLKLNLNPFLSIAIKSFVVVLLFTFAIIKLKLSDEINEIVRRYL